MYLRFRRRGKLVFPLVVMAMALTMIGSPVVARTLADPAVLQPHVSSAASGIPLEQRAQTLGVGWQQSADRMVTEDGDATGLHLLVADAKDGYQWRTAASL